MLAIIFIFLNLFQPVYVEWVDITATDSGWHTPEDIDEWDVEVNVVKQLGFIYKESPKYIIILDSYFDEFTLGTATKIPRCNIIKMYTLKL